MPTVPTVLQWVRKLEAQIEAQKLYARPYEARYNNEFTLPFIAQEYREVYGTAVDRVMPSLQAPKTGVAAIGVDALTERLTVLGGDSEDPATARALQAAWEDNDLDVMHREAHREAFIKARGFGAVTRSVSNTSKAVMTIEPPEHAAVHRQAGPPYDVDAYLKIWTDEWTAQRRGLLQLPGEDYDLVEEATPMPDPQGSDVVSRWRASAPTTRPGPVPVVEFPNRGRLLVEPKSDIERIVTEVDLVDLIEGLMVFAGHFGAVPIRYAEGFEMPRDPKDPTKPLLGPDGKPAVGFNPRADHMWFGGKGVKFGQLTPAGLDSFVSWSNHAASRIRAQTSIASTYYSIDLKSHMSAELLKTDEAPMVRRVLGIGPEGVFNQAWRRAMGHMMRIEGQTGRIKPRWEDPGTRIEAQAVDSFTKAVASGLGIRACAQKFLGWDPDLIERAVAEAEAREDALAAAADPLYLLPPETRAQLKAVPTVDDADPDAAAGA